MAEKKLEVKNLTISFKTDNGLVQAVRNVSFDLDEEETLCIVGESGSGKSVTSKAIMGILANNAVVEGGEILYEGENLLEVSEEEYHKIRGNKIGMIFQDPLSSLNPIVRIGKQITEAMLINSDKVKKMYEEKISKELIAYKNVIARRNIKVKKAKDEFVLTLKRAQKDNATKETLAKIKKEAAATRKAKIADAEKECNNALPPLKKALDEKKAQAKKEVNEYKKSVKDAYKPIRKENTSKILNALKSRNKEEIKQAKEKYIQDRDAYLDQLKITKKEAKRRAIEIMGEVGIPLPEKRFRQYPFEFSGGMRQRIVIAIALTAAPEILICDEPTTALDVTIQAQILELIKKIQKERHISCIFITHDLGVVANMADRVAVMYAGKIVECGTAEEIFYDPKHPYTWALLASIPDIDSKERLEAIPGTPPDMIYPPKGDAFALRSKYAMKIDFEQEPPMFKISDTHYAATWLLHPDAPKVKMPKIVETRIKNALKESKANKKKEGAPNDGE
ncbi:MAG: oligopeptide/dipeptide ABC transporter ATP-binding protein [Bacilli bacterium]